MLQDGMTVKGFLKGLPGMCIGEIRRLTVPPHLAFGSRGTGMTIFIRNMVGFI
jgi:FK506-binding protein 14